MSRVIYPNPPIEEATCQFTLAEELPWDEMTPSLLFGELRTDYPGLPSQQHLVQANIGGSSPGGMPEVGIAGNVRFVFADSENVNRLSVGRSAISVHRARPYRSFKNELLVRIRRDVPRIMALLNQEDLFKAVSVRYINRIIIPEITFALRDYFNYWGADNGLPKPFDKRTTGFFYRTNALHNEQSENVTVTFGSADSGGSIGTFILDIDLAHNFTKPAKTDEVIDRMIDIQGSVNSIFESLVTDKCRELFG
ncbi:MAG: TIGR04255 family protein [Streptosporangiaceae bacterium]